MSSSTTISSRENTRRACQIPQATSAKKNGKPVTSEIENEAADARMQQHEEPQPGARETVDAPHDRLQPELAPVRRARAEPRRERVPRVREHPDQRTADRDRHEVRERPQRTQHDRLREVHGRAVRDEADERLDDDEHDTDRDQRQVAPPPQQHHGEREVDDSRRGDRGPSPATFHTPKKTSTGTTPHPMNCGRPRPSIERQVGSGRSSTGPGASGVPACRTIRFPTRSSRGPSDRRDRRTADPGLHRRRGCAGTPSIIR